MLVQIRFSMTFFRHMHTSTFRLQSYRRPDRINRVRVTTQALVCKHSLQPYVNHSQNGVQHKRSDSCTTIISFHTCHTCGVHRLEKTRLCMRFIPVPPHAPNKKTPHTANRSDQRKRSTRTYTHFNQNTSIKEGDWTAERMTMWQNAVPSSRCGDSCPSVL